MLTVLLCDCDMQVIINARRMNAALPHAILGFFVLEGQSSVTHLDYSRTVDVVRAHRDFLAAFPHLTSAESVPLLTLSPSNWHEPFSPYRPRQ